ncbi:MAG: T9SS type A sorting domain-containing protein [Chitinophagaceae bacterium]|nr:T9SS type A sorting domain-containing protein [Chitinophagaceae bacterium]
MRVIFSRRNFTILFRASWILLLVMFSASVIAQPLSVTNLSGFYRNGQVFLTWQNIEDSLVYYKVYRSNLPITNTDQLAACEYLGWTNSESSKDHNLSKHDGIVHFLVIDSGSAPLTKSTGLFVATTLLDGNYYYAVTTVNNGIEQKDITVGVNALQNPVSEKVAEPQPVFQQQRLISEKEVEIYATFASSKYAIGQPLMNEAGFITNDFILYRNGATGGQHPIRIRFHGGGADFFYNVLNVKEDEINLNPEDFLPGGDNSSWWGANENYNIFNSDSNLVPPVSGINYNFCHQRITQLINWVIKNLPVDSNRIYLEGTSLGSIGAFYYTMLYPERIAAIKLSGSVFDLSFQNDYNPVCSLNPGMSNRVNGDNKFGMVSTNLSSNLGIPFYNLVDGNWLLQNFNEKDYPVIYSVNGKNDSIVGWTEKTYYYNSVNANHTGGYYFWDGRGHGGGPELVWSDENFNILKYRRNVLFPAFAYCSTNEDPGDGHSTDGEAYGTVNGFLDWKDNIIDDSSFLRITLFMKDLIKQDKTIYPAPDNCTADVTLRRRQVFQPSPGDTLWWNVLHNNSVIQSGMQVYQGGIITIPQVFIYKDSIQLTVATDSVNLSGNVQDAALFTYPNPVTATAIIQWKVTTPGKCSLKIYDVAGRWIRTLAEADMAAGIYQSSWNADNGQHAAVNTGIYLLRLETPDHSETKKIMVFR